MVPNAENADNTLIRDWGLSHMAADETELVQSALIGVLRFRGYQRSIVNQLSGIPIDCLVTY